MPWIYPNDPQSEIMKSNILHFEENYVQGKSLLEKSTLFRRDEACGIQNLLGKKD